MVILKDILLWILVSVHVVGTAFLFRRLFPRESVWLAFVIPEIIFVLACNFIEYHIPLTQLPLLLPLTTMASIGLIFWPKSPWRVMRLPTLIFLGVFAFTLTLRILRPSIEDSRDGIPDLSLIANYMFGQTLPPESTWLPPIKMESYYCLEHYGASLLIRLLGIDIGTGFNLSVALLLAYVYFLASAVAWHLSRGKLWIVILTPVLIASAATGDAGYLWLAIKNTNPENVIDPYSLVDDKTNEGNWLVSQLTPLNYYDRHLLMSPGYGSWMGCLHSAQTGQLIICFALLALIEIVRKKRTNWPWICLLISPFLMLTTCTWGVPIIGCLIALGLIVCLRIKVAPASLGVVLTVSAGLSVLLEPMMNYFLEAVPSGNFGWATGLHTQVSEFIVQWWPVYLPWLLLLFIQHRVHPVTRIVLIISPLAFAAVESLNLGERFDTTSKFWGLIYVAAWIVFLPEVARQRTWPFRVAFILIVVNCVLSFGLWVTYYNHVVPREQMAHLDGRGQLGQDLRKRRLLEVVSRLDNQVIISGRSAWAYSESSLLPIFSHNRSYEAWTNFSDTILYTNGISEGIRREFEVNKIYDGKIADPLSFLREHNIAALVIYPDDNVNPEVVGHLKQVLAPYYTYEDGNYRTPDELANGTSPQRPCAGVFLYQPSMTDFRGPPHPMTK